MKRLLAFVLAAVVCGCTVRVPVALPPQVPAAAPEISLTCPTPVAATTVVAPPTDFSPVPSRAPVKPGPKPLHHKVGAAATPNTDRLSFATGTSAGTVTVAAGFYVVGWTAVATGSGVTVTITPSGPDITSPVAQSAISIPSNFPFSMGYPAIKGNPDELGDGTTIVFAGANLASYVVVLYQYR